MNALEVYEDAGYKAGRASLQYDQATARHWREWVKRALALESEPYRTMARNAFRRHYTRGAHGVI